MSKELVDQVIKKYGVRISTQTADEYRCYCILHEDSNPSFSINKNTGLWTCFSGCGAGNLISLTMKINKCGYEEAKKILYGEENFLKVNGNHNGRPKVELTPRIELPDGFELIKEPKECPKYLLNRIKFSTVLEFKIGVCHTGYYRNRIVVPVRQNKSTVGFIARDFSGNAEKKHLFPIGFKKADFLFNSDNITSNEVILVEGPFDAMSMYEKGFRNTVCMFGIIISPRQVNILMEKKVDNIVMCLDNDEGKSSNHGLIAAQQTAKKFRHIFSNISIMTLPPGRDPDECTQMELSRIYRAKRGIKLQGNLSVNI